MYNSDLSDVSSYSDSSSGEYDDQRNVSNDMRAIPLRRDTDQTRESIQKSMSKSVDDGFGPSTTFKIEAQMVVEGDAMTVKISPDKTAFAVGLSNGIIRVFFMDKKINEKVIIALSAPNEKLPCNCIVFVDSTKVSSAKDRHNLLAVYSSGYIRLWDCFDDTPHPTMIFEIFEYSVPCDFNQVRPDDIVSNELLCVAISTDATRFVTGGVDTIIKVYELRTKTRLLDLKSGQKSECTHHSNRVTALVYHPRGETDPSYSHIFVSAGWDRTIHIWDDRNSASLWHYYGPHVVGSDGIDIDGGQNIIITSSWPRSSVIIKMWKFADFALTGKSPAAKRKFLMNYSLPVNEVALNGPDATTQGYVARLGGNGRYIFFTGFGENILKVIERENVSAVAGMSNLPNAIYSLDSCLDGSDKRRCMVVFTNTDNVFVASVVSRLSPAELYS